VSESWTSAYIATSALLGEALDATLASMAPLPPPAAALANTLRSGSREVRAQALARALSEVVLALDAVRLA
jgi:hypothetical protein